MIDLFIYLGTSYEVTQIELRVELFVVEHEKNIYEKN